MSEEQHQEKSTPVVNKYQFASFPLYEHKTPEFKEVQGYKYFKYGQDNSYADYLVYLYNRSSVHNAIVDGKVRFILGNGWTTQDPQLQKFIASANNADSLDELSHKVILDRRIFGGYALKIVWFGGRISAIYHIPFQKLRVSVPSEEYPTPVYFHSNEWTQIESTKAKFKANAKMPEDVRVFKPFNPAEGIGEQILYVVDYRPQTNVYPIPEYHPCNAAIETDIEIDNFHLNNIKTGFAAGKMLTLKNGVPDDDERKKLEKDIKSKVAGTDNAGEILINFAEPNESAVEITDLRANDLDKQYEQLSKDTRDKIFIGHGITSPMLFGVKTEGQLGGRNELDLAWQLMNINYIEPKRKQFENEINYIFNVGGYSGKMEIQPMSRLPIELSEATILGALSKNEVRTMVIDAVGIKNKEQGKQDDILTTLNSISPLVANKILNSLTKNQILAMIGLSPVAGGDTEPTDGNDAAPEPTLLNKDIANIDEILLNKFSSTGIDIGKVEFADDEDEQRLLDYLKKNKTLDIEKATKELKIDVKKILEALIARNAVAANVISENKIEIERVEPEPPKTQGYEIVTMYEYSWVDPANSSDIDNSRDFCQRLLKMNKLWTREEIDMMNNEMKDFNTDVWKYRGGWMTVPNTDGLVHVPSCRHYWKSRFVKKPI